MGARVSESPQTLAEFRHFFALDTRTYRPGALDATTKELLGLVWELPARQTRKREAGSEQ